MAQEKRKGGEKEKQREHELMLHFEADERERQIMREIRYEFLMENLQLCDVAIDKWIQGAII